MMRWYAPPPAAFYYAYCHVFLNRHNSTLALPFAVFAPRNETQKQRSLEQKMDMDRMLCVVVPQCVFLDLPSPFGSSNSDVMYRDPELQARTFASSGNYHTISFFPSMCLQEFGIDISSASHTPQSTATLPYLAGQ